MECRRTRVDFIELDITPTSRPSPMSLSLFIFCSLVFHFYLFVHTAPGRKTKRRRNTRSVGRERTLRERKEKKNEIGARWGRWRNVARNGSSPARVCVSTREASDGDIRAASRGSLFEAPPRYTSASSLCGHVWSVTVRSEEARGANIVSGALAMREFLLK